MNKKLTLSLDNSVIETAKKYARSHNISLSKLIESYLNTLTIKKKEEVVVTPLVESLSGVITLDRDFDGKDAYTQYLMERSLF